MSDNESVSADEPHISANQTLKDKILNASSDSAAFLKKISNISSAFPSVAHLSLYDKNMAFFSDAHKKANFMIASLTERHSLMASLAEKYSPVISLAEKYSLITSVADKLNTSVFRHFQEQDNTSNLSIALKSIDSRHSPLINNPLLLSANNKLFASLGLLNKNNRLFNNSETFIEYMSGIVSDDSILPVSPLSEDEVSTYQNKLSNIDRVNSEASFESFFSSLPKKLQSHVAIVILHFILMTLFTLSCGVTVNLITPTIQDYLFNSSKNDKQKVHDIKNLITVGVNKHQMRFITKNIVYLREKPSQKSSIIDELTLGQIVVVQSKNKNWIEVSYQYESGEVVQGWVFTRYTERFKW